jgi:transcriptional regulator NrdR family protein
MKCPECGHEEDKVVDSRMLNIAWERQEWEG